jgi:hypothetical protein
MSFRSKRALLAMAAQRKAVTCSDPQSGRERASATTLDAPGSKSRLLVYSDMKARCRTQHPVEGEDQRFVIGPQLEQSVLMAGGEMFYTFRRWSNLPQFWRVFCCRNPMAANGGLLAGIPYQ